jgi:serine/threonine protein kinase
MLQQLRMEVSIHKTLNHRHVVKLEHYFEDSVNAYILLELCPNHVSPCAAAAAAADGTDDDDDQ